MGRRLWVAKAVSISVLGLVLTIFDVGSPLDLLAGFALLVGWIVTPVSFELVERIR
jgi:hypothetical protein